MKKLIVLLAAIAAGVAIVSPSAVAERAGPTCSFPRPPQGDFSPSWSADGRRVAFEREQSVLHTSSRGRAEPFRVAYGTAPTWSPNGTLAFARGVALPPTYRPNETVTTCGPGLQYDLYTARADGSGEANVTASPEYDADPAWSPNGNRLAYVTASPEGTGRQLVIVEADGRRSVVFADAGWSIRNPAWSPDGQSLVFTRDYGAEPNSDIFRIRVDGTGLARVTRTRLEREDDATWSPDGSRIAFTRYNSWPGATAAARILTRTPAGTRERALGAGRQPAWSPDGKRIAFASRPADDETSRIYVMRADGSYRRRLT